MQDSTTTSSSSQSTPTTPNAYGRAMAEVTCSRCGSQASVPFTPTPGRPVYCRPCFERRPASPARGGLGRGRGGHHGNAEPNVQPARRMLSYRRKGHFVHDALAGLEDNDAMDEEQRRTFVEMVFARGARQTTRAALDFLDEKREEGVVSDAEAAAVARAVEHYSQRR